MNCVVLYRGIVGAKRKTAHVVCQFMINLWYANKTWRSANRLLTYINIQEIIDCNIACQRIEIDSFWFECEYTTTWPDDFRKRHGVAANIGTNIQDNTPGFDHLAKQPYLALREFPISFKGSTNPNVLIVVNHQSIATLSDTIHRNSPESKPCINTNRNSSEASELD